MLSAINDKGQLIQLPGRHIHELIPPHNQESYFCPQCKAPVLVRAGSKVVPHFAHFPNSSCPSSKSGEGAYHQQGKVRLWEWLQAQGYNPVLEGYLPEIGQRPDLLLQTKSRRIAIEYQCARISEKEIAKRTRQYNEIGIFPFWILGGNRVVRKGSGLLQLTAFERNFIYHYRDYRIHFFDPVTDQMMIGYHLQGSGSNLVFSIIRYFPLAVISLKNVFAEPNLLLNDMPAGWKSFVKKRRTRPLGHTSPQEKSWRQYLYAKSYHPSLLPSITYLPVPSQIQLTEPPWIWQSRYYLDTFLKTPVGGLLPIKPAKMIVPLLHVHVNPNPLQEYLTMLCRLGLAEEVSSGVYRKRQEVKAPLTIEEAIKQDEIIFNSLKSG
ncbi:competence protein CoiA [Thalassobacillus devorans]|uniref:competence protein CoiA n=1 Tax=Thalassobacillus devorans TaxID=279813 RepID=UPI00048F58F4|nr:competence protein CoiA family protein [Thalassobacillus devorans]